MCVSWIRRVRVYVVGRCEGRLSVFVWEGGRGKYT